MHETLPYRRVLALIRFDSTDEKIARKALLLARLNRAQLAFLHLVEPDESMGGGYPGIQSSLIAATMEKDAIRRLDYLTVRLGAGEAECLADFGPRSQMFQRTLRNWQPDLVVVAGPPPARVDTADCLITAQSLQAGGGKLRRWGEWLVSGIRPAFM
jgi:nucleotide-binding universal stress UspA family protein